MTEKRDKGTQIVICGIPHDLLAEIDSIAASEERSRSRQTMLLLKEIVAIKRSMQPQVVTR
jgi:metal-responsive CopG/Arc/MetJ family transcriptional regulator